MRPPVIVSILAAVFTICRAYSQDVSSKGLERPNVPIDYVALLPGTNDCSFNGEIGVEFAIYVTPTGGRAIWMEKQVVVAKDGMIDTQLGRNSPIPWEITVANFKFVSVRVDGGPEILPRMPIVNVVYFAKDALGLRTDQVYRVEQAMEAQPRPERTWAEAFAVAAQNGTSLPSYRYWYAAAVSGKLEEFIDHYEWTVPWVYDTASHGALNEYFRGRFQGCDYLDLDPALNRYRFRLVNESVEHHTR